MAEEKKPKLALRLELSPRQAQVKLRDLIATEGSIFDSLKGKRVYFESVSSNGANTGIISRYGLDFIEFKDIRKYGYRGFQEEISKYERGEKPFIFYQGKLGRYLGSQNSIVLNKNQIEQICELDDFPKREES